MLVAKTATPTEIRPFGQPDNFGNSSFGIKFNDGSEGRYSVRATTQDYFIIGTPVEFMYDATRISKAGKPDPWIKRMDAQQYQQQPQAQVPQQQPVAPQPGVPAPTPQAYVPRPPPVYNQPPPPMPQVPVQGNKPLPKVFKDKKQEKISVGVNMSYALEWLKFINAKGLNELGKTFMYIDGIVQARLKEIDEE